MDGMSKVPPPTVTFPRKKGGGNKGLNIPPQKGGGNRFILPHKRGGRRFILPHEGGRGECYSCPQGGEMEDLITSHGRFRGRVPSLTETEKCE